MKKEVINPKCSFELEKRLSVFEDRAAGNIGIIVTTINDAVVAGIDGLIGGLGMVFPEWAKKIKEEMNLNDDTGLLGRDIGIAKQIELGWRDANAKGEEATWRDLPSRFR